MKMAKMAQQFESYSVFQSKGSDLIRRSTKDVATDEIKHLNEFVQFRLLHDGDVSSYAPLKKKNSKTFSDLCKAKAVLADGKEKTLKADRNLFQRLFVAAQSGRHVQLISLVKHELSPSHWHWQELMEL